jgi:hypothetical protein
MQMKSLHVQGRSFNATALNFPGSLRSWLESRVKVKSLSAAGGVENGSLESSRDVKSLVMPGFITLKMF